MTDLDDEVGTGIQDVVETVGAFVACAAIVTSPVWLAILVSSLAGPLCGAVTFMFLTVGVVVLPAAVPLDERPELDAPRRWGKRVGRFLRRPLDRAEAHRNERTQRALGASSSTSSAAAPSLPPVRD